MRQIINLRAGLRIALAMMLALSVCAAPVFAEEDITVSVTVGEHGSVDGHTSDYTESIASGSDITLSFRADTGYVISTVLVNGAGLTASDLNGVLGETSGSLKLEDLTEDLNVEVMFDKTADPAAEDQEGDASENAVDFVPEGETDSDTESGDGTGETQDPGTGSEEDGDTVSGTGAETDGTSDEGTDAATDAADESGSSVDTVETTSDDDPAAYTTETQNTDTASYDTTPKTGDGFPKAALIGILLSSLAGLAGVIFRRAIRRRIALLK